MQSEPLCCFLCRKSDRKTQFIGTFWELKLSIHNFPAWINKVLTQTKRDKSKRNATAYCVSVHVSMFIAGNSFIFFRSVLQVVYWLKQRWIAPNERVCWFISGGGMMTNSKCQNVNGALVKKCANRPRLLDENVMMLKSIRFHSKELDNGYENVPVKLYCVRGCTLLATGRFSMFYHMPAMVQRDEGVKLLGNHSICVIWACRHHLSALTQNLVKPGLKGSCSLTDAVNS